MIIFQNPGHLDIRSLTVFGTSSKDNPESAIGYFGTGLKYAIAILLREHCEIEIISGAHHWTFFSETETLRNDTFQFIYMRDLGHTSSPIRLAFTTELGKDWPLWMAFRELESNTRDEGGHSFTPEVPDEVIHDNACTTILVRGQAFETIFRRKSEYFLDTPSLFDTPFGSVHPGNGGVYYKGVRVYTAPIISRFHYNITDLKLTENRTPESDYSVRRKICDMWHHCENTGLIKELFLSGDNWEKSFDWNDWALTEPGPIFMSVVEPLWKSRSTALPESLRVRLQSLQPTPPFVPTYAKPTGLQTKAIDRSVEFLASIGVQITAPIHICANLGDGIMGRAWDGQILISHLCFNQGQRYLCSTILEEHVHLTTGFKDETRELQTYLFDMVLSTGEQLKGELL